jgi:hypothetical protein
MGFDSFIDPAWDANTFALRLVLKPSFHPEFCLTVIGAPSNSEMAAVCLTEMFWQQASPRQLPAFNEKRRVQNGMIRRVESLCSAINTDAERPICLDGMGMNAVWTLNGELIRFDSHVYAETVSRFVSTLLELAWGTFITAGIRNGIANCGRYIGLEYPLEPEPKKPEQLLVLGNPDNVADYFEQLRKHRNGA